MAVVEGNEKQVKLTARQKEVLALVAEGKSSKEVANELFVSKRTIDLHLSSIFNRLDVRNRITALNKARDLALI